MSLFKSDWRVFQIRLGKPVHTREDYFKMLSQMIGRKYLHPILGLGVATALSIAQKAGLLQSTGIYEILYRYEGIKIRVRIRKIDEFTL